MSRTCTLGFRDRCPAVRRPGNGGGLRSCPSATESPHALAPRLPTLGINPPWKLVGPDGNAPSSIGYQPIALLLSYEPMLAESGGLAPQPAEPIHLLSKQRPRLGGFTLQSGGEQWSCPTSLAARNGFQPITALRGFALRKVAEARGHAPQRPNVARSASNGCRRLGRFRLRSPRGRICTCVDPLRRRRPELLGHAEKVDLAAGLPPTTQRSKRCMIVISPREGKWSSRRELHPELGLRRAV